jgi:spore germination protein
MGWVYARTRIAITAILALLVALPLLTLVLPSTDAATSPTTTVGLSPLSERRVVTGWIPHYEFSEGLASVLAHPDVVSETSPFWYRATVQSQVRSQTDNAQPESTLISGIDDLHAVGIAALPSINDEGMNATEMAGVLKDVDRRSALIEEIVAMVVRTGADGADIDFESMNVLKAGGVGADRTAVKKFYPIFLDKLRTRLHEMGALLSVTVPARRSESDPNWEVFDYDAIGRSVDRVRVMTYDYSTDDTGPGPIGPLDWTRDVIKYAKSEFKGVPLSIGTPQYGQNWYIKTLRGSCPDAAKVTVSPTAQQALGLIDTYNATPVWSDSAGEYHYDYRRPYPEYGNCVVQRRVWFGEGRSALTRLQLAQQLGVQGIAVWRIGVEDPALWKKAETFAKSLSPAPARASITVPPSVDYGAGFTLEGKFSVSGLPIAGEQVTVLRRVPGKAWSAVGTATTLADGSVSIPKVADRTFEWRLRLAPSWDWATTLTPVARVAARHVVSATVVDPVVAPGETFVVTGTVAPAEEGTSVTLQKRVDGRWVGATSRRTAADGSFTLKGSFQRVEEHEVRVVATADSQHSAGFSATLTVTVE